MTFTPHDVGSPAVLAELLGVGEGQRLGRRLGRAVGHVVPARPRRLRRRHDDDAALARLQRGQEGAGRVLQGADEQIVQRVPRRGVRAGAPAADEVHERVDALERPRPPLRRGGVEQVDLALRRRGDGVAGRLEEADDMGAERPAGPRDGDDAPAHAVTSCPASSLPLSCR
jgi:hypothetical protein